MKSPKIMYTYAGFLVICGLIAFAMAGFEMRAITALLAPAIAGGVMVACGAMAAKVHTSHTLAMIGIHEGMVIPVLLAGLFGMLSYRRFTAEEPVMYLATIFAVLTVGSLIAFIAILLNRPKPEART